jgi:four helix bundle protein
MGFETQVNAMGKDGAATAFSHRDYKDLYVWREAVGLVVEVELWAMRCSMRLRRQADEGFVRTSVPLWTHARRAAVAAAAKIAEGHSTRRADLFACYLRSARGHFAELQTALAAAEQLGALAPEGLAALEDMLAGIMGPLNRLIASVQERA